MRTVSRNSTDLLLLCDGDTLAFGSCATGVVTLAGPFSLVAWPLVQSTCREIFACKLGPAQCLMLASQHYAHVFATKSQHIDAIYTSITSMHLI